MRAEKVPALSMLGLWVLSSIFCLLSLNLPLNLIFFVWVTKEKKVGGTNSGLTTMHHCSLILWFVSQGMFFKV